MDEQFKYMVCTQCITFNHANYIEDTLRGFAMQETDFPVVFVIVDDASTDDEQLVLRKWADKNMLFSDGGYQNKEENGEILFGHLTYNKNLWFAIFLLSFNHYSRGISKLRYIERWSSEAKYEAMCEGDDYWITSDKLQKQVDFLESHKGFGMVYTAFQYFYPSTNNIIDMYTDASIQHDNNFKWELLEQKAMVGTCVGMIKTELLKEIRSYKDDFTGYLMSDTQLWFHSARLAKVGYIPEVTGTYRKHMTGATATFDSTRRQKFIRGCLDLHLHLAYKYGAPEKTVKIIKDKFGIYCFNMCLRQGEYENAKIMNKSYFHDSKLLSISIWLSKLMGLKKLRVLGPLHHIEGRSGLINMK